MQCEGGGETPSSPFMNTDKAFVLTGNPSFSKSSSDYWLMCYFALQSFPGGGSNKVKLKQQAEPGQAKTEASNTIINNDAVQS